MPWCCFLKREAISLRIFGRSLPTHILGLYAPSLSSFRRLAVVVNNIAKYWCCCCEEVGEWPRTGVGGRLTASLALKGGGKHNSEDSDGKTQPFPQNRQASADKAVTPLAKAFETDTKEGPTLPSYQ